MTARGRAGKRKDGLPKAASPFAAAKQGWHDSVKRQFDKIEQRALKRTASTSEWVTIRVQLAKDMTALCDRGWQVRGMSNRGLYNLNTVWVLQVKRAELEGRYAKEEAEAVQQDGQGRAGD